MKRRKKNDYSVYMSVCLYDIIISVDKQISNKYVIGVLTRMPTLLDQS